MSRNVFTLFGEDVDLRIWDNGRRETRGRKLFDTKGLIASLQAHLRERDAYKLTGDGLLDCLREHEKLINIVTASAIEVAAEAEAQGVPAQQGCKDLTVLLRTTLKIAPEDAARRSQLVRQLPGLDRTRKKLHAGKISVRHAQVIANTVDKVPADKAKKVEKVLCRHAPRLNPRQLMYAAKVARATIDPEGTYRDEKEGIAQRSMKMGTNEHGHLHLIGSFDTLTGQKIQALLHALAKKRAGDDRTTEQRYADAFAEVIDLALTAKALPTHGGERPQVIVTISYADLMASLGTGFTAWGEPISAGLARQIACDANILPVLLGSEGRLLDVGRNSRTATPAMRKGLAVRDKGCAFPGCDRPPAWTEAHHVLHWLHGGETKIDNLVLLCSHHHHVMHDEGWEIVFDNGLPTFIPPRWVDPDQTPMRNIRVDPLFA
ncbi:HNH endonuclease signature motif containing protein [Allokutzneria sp. NRRL B-24872]|uniref:HNH endonuclease signature motif containing protein n=1 Tax=Allokutzneria sp. NRRL B-24872 TaxID=1137961 RepID=UPI00143D6010|nr:HNH endonuclease signature motif containing protein [Allokutzneria sp. NRRL B-24872]